MRALTALLWRRRRRAATKSRGSGVQFAVPCGNVKIRRGSWNEELFRVLEGFPDLAHDDEVDARSGALEMLNREMKSRGIFERYRKQAEELGVKT